MSTEAKRLDKLISTRRAWFNSNKPGKKRPYKVNKQVQNLAKHTTFKMDI